MISSNGRKLGAGTKTSDFNYCNSRCPTNTAHTATRMGNGKGSAPLFSSIPMHTERIGTRECGQRQSPNSGMLHALLMASFLSCQERTGLMFLFIYGMYVHCAFICRIHFFFPHSLSLFWQETTLILTRCHAFSFFFFSRDVAASHDKSLRCIRGKCRTDRQYSNNQVHSFLGICSGYINFLCWLNCTYLI